MTERTLVNVSRETNEKLEAFVQLVEKWTPKINLISKSSIPEIWDRHIVDSAQLYDMAPCAGHWLDIGSGGGFPGIVVAILSDGDKKAHQFTLIESDQRKCAFLRTAARELLLDVKVLSQRIEEVPPIGAGIITARALADLSTLLSFAERHLDPDGTALFSKGETWKKEHDKALEMWSYRHEAIMSTTNTAAAVLKIQDIARV